MSVAPVRRLDRRVHHGPRARRRGLPRALLTNRTVPARPPDVVSLDARREDLAVPAVRLTLTGARPVAARSRIGPGASDAVRRGTPRGSGGTTLGCGAGSPRANTVLGARDCELWHVKGRHPATRSPLGPAVRRDAGPGIDPRARKHCRRADRCPVLAGRQEGLRRARRGPLCFRPGERRGAPAHPLGRHRALRRIRVRGPGGDEPSPRLLVVAGFDAVDRPVDGQQSAGDDAHRRRHASRALAEELAVSTPRKTQRDRRAGRRPTRGRKLDPDPLGPRALRIRRDRRVDPGEHADADAAKPPADRTDPVRDLTRYR